MNTPLWIKITIVFVLWIYVAQIEAVESRPQLVRRLIGSRLVLNCSIPTSSDIENYVFYWSVNHFGYQNSSLFDSSQGRQQIIGDASAGEYNLLIKDVQERDNVSYSCQIDVKYRRGEAYITNMIRYILKVVVPPKSMIVASIKTQSSNGNLVFHPPEKPRTLYSMWGVEGIQVNLNCSTSRSLPLTKIGWKVSEDRNKYKLNFRSTGLTKFSLDVALHNSRLHCFVQNKKDYLQSPVPEAIIRVRVLYIQKAEIVKLNDPAFLGIREAETVTFQCRAQVTKEAKVTYRWHVTLYDGNMETLETPRPSSDLLLFTGSPNFHRARLYCTISASLHTPCDTPQSSDLHENRQLRPSNCSINSTRQIFTTNVLNIKFGPQIDVPYASVTVDRLGQPSVVLLGCGRVDGNPPPTLRWHKADVGTSPSTRSMHWYHRTRLASLQESLRFSPVLGSGPFLNISLNSLADLDIYVCEASSPGFPAAYRYVMVAQKEKPSVRIDSSAIKVKLGSTVSLMCLFESWPKLSSYPVRWHKENTDTEFLSSGKNHYIENRNQLMGIQSKLFFTKIVYSDYGTYNCSVKYGANIASAIITLVPIASKMSIIIPIGLFGALILIIVITVIICCCKKWRKSHYQNKKGQQIVYASPTMDSGLEHELFMSSRVPSLHSYPRGDGSVTMAPTSAVPGPNRCFVFGNSQEMMSKISCGDFRYIPDEKAGIRGNERSWDSGVCPDDATAMMYRNGGMIGQPPPPPQAGVNPRGSYCVSPFSTLASSNNSINNGGGSSNHGGGGNAPTQLGAPPPLPPNQRYWVPSHSQLGTDHSGPPSSSMTSTFVDPTGSACSSFIGTNNTHNSNGGPVLPPNAAVMMANSSNQSFVCIPVEEYQQHIRMMRDNRSFTPTNSYHSSRTDNGANGLGNSHHSNQTVMTNTSKQPGANPGGTVENSYRPNNATQNVPSEPEHPPTLYNGHSTVISDCTGPPDSLNSPTSKRQLLS